MNCKHVALLGIFFILSAMIFLATDPSYAQTTSGYYDFEIFGETSDSKPIGDLLPLIYAVPNAKTFSGWYNSQTYPYWIGDRSAGNTTTIVNNRYSYPVELGFNFNFYGEIMDTMKASDNYYISFDMTQQSSSSGTNVRIPNSGNPNKAIFMFWDDGHIYNGRYVDPVISNGMIGSTVGLRNNITEYYCVQRQAGSNVVNYYTGWVRLYETTNIVELYFFKLMSSTCYQVNCDSDVGMEFYDGTTLFADEPPTNPDGDPACVSLWYNDESWHNGPADSQGRTGCRTCVSNCIPKHHYRFIPKTFAWDAPAPNDYWPQTFETMSSDYPDWWSLVNEDVKSNTWRYSSTGYGSFPSGCMYTDAASSNEILVTRFVDFTGVPLPALTFSYDFANDNNHNRADIVMTVNGLSWQTIWTHQGSSSNGTLTVPIFNAANQQYVQIGFKYSRDDLDPSMFTTVLDADMDTDPSWTHSGIGDEWEWNEVTNPGSIDYNHGVGPRAGYDGSYFYCLDSGNDGSGSYNQNCDTTLTSSPADCSSLQYVEVSFYRWLGVERYSTDRAIFEVSNDGGVSWTTVWQNPTIHICDTDWKYLRYDISSIAAGHADVRLRWSLRANSDSSTRSCGWNLDNVKISGLPYMPVGYFAIDNISFYPEPTPTPTETPTMIPTETPTMTATPTETPFPTNTPTATITGVPTHTPIPSATPTVPSVPTATPTLEATATTTPTNPQNVTPTPTDYPQLNCANFLILECDTPMYADPNQPGMWESNVDDYICIASGWSFNGNEVIFSFTAPETGQYSLLLNTTGYMMVILLDSCSASLADCKASFTTLTFDGIQDQEYYIVVDGDAVMEDFFTINISCPTGGPPIPSTNPIGITIAVFLLGSILVFTSRRKSKKS